MAFIGSAEIILILMVIIFLIVPVLVILGILYVIFRNRNRVKELEARVAALEKAEYRRSDGK